MQRRLSVISSFIIVTAILVISGCYYDNEALLYPGGTVDCTTVNAKFSVDVKPIIQAKCNTAGCHNAASVAGGVVLETHAQVAAKAARINQRCVVEKSMPPGGPLTPGEIAILKCWIDSGSPNN